MKILSNSEIQRNNRLKELYLQKKNKDVKEVKPVYNKPSYSEERIQRELEEVLTKFQINK